MVPLSDDATDGSAPLFNNAITTSPWRQDYTRVPRLGNGRISKEIVVKAKADWVMSYWGGGFSEDRGITPQLLKQVGINSYVQTESCFGYGDKKPVPPMESVYADLMNLGKIFSPFFCAWRKVSIASISDMCTISIGASTRRASEIARLVASASATRAWAIAWNLGAP